MIQHIKRAAILGLTLVVLAVPAFAQTTTQRPANPQMRSTGGGADMSCPGDKVVWVNTKKRDLSLQGRTLVRQYQAGQIHVRARRRCRRRSPHSQRPVGRSRGNRDEGIASCGRPVSIGFR